MAAKKDNSLSSRKEAAGKRPWPNLPHQLLNLLARKPNLLQQISYPGPTKSWATVSRRCSNSKLPQNPRLYDLEDSKWHSLSKTLPQFINIYFRTQVYQWWCYNYTPLPLQFWICPTTHFLSCSHGSLIIIGGFTPLEFQIYEVSTRISWGLPPWDSSIPFKFAALSSSAGDPVVVILTGISSPALMVYRCRQGEYAWIKQEFAIVDPFDCKKLFMEFTNIIGFKGKFYALSLQGTLAIMEEKNSRLVITKISKSRAVPSVTARYFKEYLLESNGEILLVFLIYCKTLRVVDKVEVFRFHIPKLSWIKIENLQETALFLENECCIWVNSGQVGCRGNCVYFTQSGDNGWCIYDMESGCISTGLVAKSLSWNEPMEEE